MSCSCSWFRIAGGAREFTLVNTYRYRLFEALDAGEMVAGLAMAGIVYLGRTAGVRCGRLVPVLMRDGQDMSG